MTNVIYPSIACGSCTEGGCPMHPGDSQSIALLSRCPSCEHEMGMHQPDGCWFTVDVGRRDSIVSCPCSVPRSYVDTILRQLGEPTGEST